jgi:hypothetical protein
VAMAMGRRAERFGKGDGLDVDNEQVWRALSVAGMEMSMAIGDELTAATRGLAIMGVGFMS